MFETLFLSTREPTGAVMFGNRNVQDDYTYYFSPPCAGFFGVVLSGFGASTCAPPVPKSVILLAGDAGALAWIPTNLKVPKFLGNRGLEVQKKT